MFLNIETFTIEPVQVTKKSKTQGLKYTTLQNVYRESTKISAKCTFDYINSGWGFTSVEGIPASGAYAPGGVAVAGVNMHVWESSAYNEDTFQSYTVEGPGSVNDRVQRVQGVMFAGYKITTAAADKYALEFTGFGNKLHDTVGDDGATAITASTGQNEVVTATVAGAPTSMDIVFVYDNQQSDVLAYTAATTAAAVQTAIRTLAPWSTATVAGAAGGPYTITNPTGVAMQPLLYILSAQVGGPGTLAIVPTTVGGMKTEPVYEVMPTDIAISYATTLAGLDSAPLVPVDQYKTDLEVGERTEQVFRQPGIEAAYVKEKEDQEHKQSAMLAYDSQSALALLIAASRAVGSAGVYFRVAFTGLEIAETGVNRQLIFDYFCRPVWKTGGASAEGAIRSCEFDLENLFDVNGIFCRRITAINELTSYTAA
jgi:hypothetical protein